MEFAMEVAEQVLMVTPIELVQGDFPNTTLTVKEEHETKRSLLDGTSQGFQQVKRKGKKIKENLGTRNIVHFKVSAQMYTFQP